MNAARSRWREAPPAALIVILMTACGDANHDVAATVGDWSLSTDRLAEMVVLAQPFPVDTASVRDLAEYWMAAGALAQESLEGDALVSEEAVREARWLERREEIRIRERERRLGDAVVIAPAEARRAYDSDSLRLVAHVLRRVGRETPSQERLLQQRTAQRILDRLIGGGSWDAAVGESEDAATRESAGLLGLFGPGELKPDALDRSAFRLGPGEASPVVQTRDGYHILYRPRFEEVSGLFTVRLRSRRLAAMERASDESVRIERNVEEVEDAMRLLGEIGDGPPAWFDSDVSLATWSGGRLTAGVAARYLASLPDQARTALLAASEAERSAFLSDLVLRELRIADAVEAGALDLAALDSILARDHRQEMAAWVEALSGPDGQAPSMEGLGRHMEAVVARRADARALPPVFEAWLLARQGHRLNPAGVSAAAERARDMIAAAGTPPGRGG